MTKPIIAITMGDPCGIGPEVIVKGLLSQGIYKECRPFVIGNAAWLTDAASRFAPNLTVRPIQSVSEASFKEGTLEVLDGRQEDLTSLKYGMASPLAASVAFHAIRDAAQLALLNEIDGITTAPIHKEGMKAIGFPFPGHTEFLADFTKTDRFGMMMVGGGLKIILTTIHLSLRDAIVQLRKETILKSICLADAALKHDFSIGTPKIAVAALNPHAGERGIFGDEEKREVIPAIEIGLKEGIDVSGPYPADTLFYQLKQGKFDAAVALYHDQALIPIKLLSFGGGVNVTVGLPFIRASVDHGTAYDIAGLGVANAGSLREALSLSAYMAKNRRDRSSRT